MRLSIIVPSIDGGVRDKRLATLNDANVEVVYVDGISPVGKARNVGLDRANGEYVGRVDSDDEITEEWLPRVLDAIEENIDCVVIDYKRLVQGKESAVVWEESGRGILSDLLVGRLSSEVWRYVTRRELWEGLQFNEDECVAEDYRLLPEVISKVRSFARVGIVYVYHENASSLMHQTGGERYRAQLYSAIERAKRWAGTEYADVAFAQSCMMAGWMYEWGGMQCEVRHYYSENLGKILSSRGLPLY